MKLGSGLRLIESWPASAAAWERSKRSLGGGVSTGMRASMKPHPLFFARGSGPRLTDIDGNTYLDYVLGWGPVILGHAHPALTQAVAARAPLGATFGACHALEYEVAERVLAAIPGTERVLWSNTGSEAAQVALRLARAATGRQRFLAARFARAQHVKADAGNDGGQPAAEIADRGGVAAREPQPGFLHGILGLGARTEHAIGDGAQVGPVALELARQKILVLHRSHLRIRPRHRG